MVLGLHPALVRNMARTHYETRIAELGVQPIWENLPETHQNQEVRAMVAALKFAQDKF